MLRRTGLQKWMIERDQEDDRLYERYGRPFEADHAGEFVAISAQGEVIIGADELSVARQAVERFGPGTFALRRIDAEAEVRWRRVV